MTPAYLAPLADHLWQSTLFVAMAGLLTLVLKRNRAHVRYCVWLAASMKFLIPFAVLVAIGRQFGWQSSISVARPEVPFVVEAISQPFSQPELVGIISPATISPVAAALPLFLSAIWFSGCAMHLLAWWVRWRRVAVIARGASAIHNGREPDALRCLEPIVGIRRPIALLSSEMAFEPAVFGIWKPVLLWPRYFGDRLVDGQVEAILAHELCHVRRWDNLAVALHMCVEAVFWFHPVVWWLEHRLIDERERACDEEVIRLGSDPQLYAESILRTCEFYAESPLVCVAGITGSDLKNRIEAIMRGHEGERLNAWRTLLVATVAIVMVAAPVAVGALNASSLAAGAQSPAATSHGRAFEVMSVKPNKSGDQRFTMEPLPGGRITVVNAPLRLLIRLAYRLQDFQIVNEPSWLNSERFDIVAKAEGNPTQAQLGLMLRALLADRFKLRTHNETRELPIYSLTTVRRDSKTGPQLHPAEPCFQAPDNTPPQSPPLLGPAPCGFRVGAGTTFARGVTMAALASTLSNQVSRVVLDRTGLLGQFDLNFEWELPLAVSSDSSQPSADGASIFTALQEQLGLKLESTRGAVDVLVIDSLQRPSDDAAALANSPLPQLVAQSSPHNVDNPAFEVASIKANKSDDVRIMELEVLPGGRFTARNVPVDQLILLAFGVRDFQLSGGPSWIKSERFDIDAKADADLTPGTAPPQLRQLLVDRFTLKVHKETREVPIYALDQARRDGKLGPALRRPVTDYCAEAAARARTGQPKSPTQPSQRIRCGMRGGQGTLTAGSIPVATFAGRLSSLVNRVVVNRTGLDGVFDFDLSWTPDQAAATDSSGPSIFTALQEQLGLKLESTRGPVEFLVIDSVEQPTPD
jgi:uncharacterized protein (TIGR03435 family)